MKTYNYDIDLMVPGQMNKEVVFNEAQLKIDLLSNPSVISFIDHIPSSSIPGEKYILQSSDSKNGHILYCADSSKGWQFLAAKSGMINFVYKENTFVIFQDGTWEKLQVVGQTRAIDNTSSFSTGSPNLQNLVSDIEHFTGIEGKFVVPEIADYLYLYVNGECTLDFNSVKTREFTMILKQHYQQAFNITWPHNILWQNKSAHMVTQTPNATDIIKFYRLVETQHFIAQVVGSNYQF